MTELRADDLRFTPSEAAEFLNQVMGLNLSVEDIAALETRTEGWIAGLQLAAISMRGHEDATGFIKSFTGSHHFVLDYLVEEVLGQQSESVQSFPAYARPSSSACAVPFVMPLCSTPQCQGKKPWNTRARQPVPRPPGRGAALVPLSSSVCRVVEAATASGRCLGRRSRIAHTRQPVVRGQWPGGRGYSPRSRCRGFRASSGSDRDGMACNGRSIPGRCVARLGEGATGRAGPRQTCA